MTAPHYTSTSAYTDPDHVKYYAIESMDFYTEKSGRNYYFKDIKFSKVKKKILFHKHWLYFYNYLLEFLINLHPKFQTYYEGSPLRVFPAFMNEWELIK